MDESYEEYRAPPKLPVVAINAVLIGCVLLVLAGIALPYLLVRPALPAMLGTGVGIGLLLWLAAFPLGLRHASWIWKLAGLAVLLGAGAGGALIAERLYHAASVRDASSFAEAEIGRGGALALPAGAAARGPLSQLYVAEKDAGDRERRDVDAAIGRTGMAALSSPYALGQNPAVLEDCGAIGGLKAGVDAQARKDAERDARLAAAADASGMPPMLREGLRKMVAPASAAGAKQALEAEKELLDATEGLCRLLARRTWSDQFGLYAFSGNADLAQARALGERREKAVGAISAAASAAHAQASEGRETVRELLSR